MWQSSCLLYKWKFCRFSKTIIKFSSSFLIAKKSTQKGFPSRAFQLDTQACQPSCQPAGLRGSFAISNSRDDGEMWSPGRLLRLARHSVTLALIDIYFYLNKRAVICFWYSLWTVCPFLPSFWFNFSEYILGICMGDFFFFTGVATQCVVYLLNIGFVLFIFWFIKVQDLLFLSCIKGAVQLNNLWMWIAYD